MAGLLSPPAASMDGSIFVNAAKKFGLPTDNDTLNKIVAMVNLGESPDNAAQKLSGMGLLSPGANSMLRVDKTPKGAGYFGVLKGIAGDVKGMDVTELSADSDINGQRILYPLVVPTLSQQEINILLSGKKPTDSIYQKAQEFAVQRMKDGLPTFARQGEIFPLPKGKK
jgi:hypothetical protein